MPHDDLDEVVAREREYHEKENLERLERVSRFYSPEVIGGLHDRFRRTMLGGVEGRAVLELGCGAGSFAFDLAASGAVVTGIDISAFRLQQAEQRAAELGQDITFKRMDAQRLEFPDNSFDRVVGGAILHHLELDTVYRELARVLRPGGLAAFIEPLGANPAINWFRNRTPTIRTEDEHPLLKADVELARRHFGRVEVDHFIMLELAAALLGRSALARYVRPPLRSLDRLVLRLPGVRWWSWQCVIRLDEPKKEG
jgi:SAM-dependent methyltransferase